MKWLVQGIFLLFLLFSCNTKGKKCEVQQDIIGMEKKNIGYILSLYPKPLKVLGEEVECDVIWLVMGHTELVGHYRI